MHTTNTPHPQTTVRSAEFVQQISETMVAICAVPTHWGPLMTALEAVHGPVTLGEFGQACDDLVASGVIRAFGRPTRYVAV